MNGYNFTERVRKVLAFARDEADRLNHEYVGTEHILLGMIREAEGSEGVGVGILRNLGVDPVAIKRKIEETLITGSNTRRMPDLPYTSRAKKVLELAMRSARDNGHTYVGTEHVLLGLIREEKGIAAQILADAGITEKAARVEMLRILRGEEVPPGEAGADPRVVAIGIELRLANGLVRRKVVPDVASAIEYLNNLDVSPDVNRSS